MIPGTSERDRGYSGNVKISVTNQEFFPICDTIMAEISLRFLQGGGKNMYVKRERYLARIRPFYDTDLIKVLTGVRRSGKSVLLEQIEEEFRSSGFDEKHIIRVNFEDLRYKDI